VAVALVVAVSAQPARATCANADLIGGCNGLCKYIFTNGATPSSALTGNFWGMGGGNPAVGLGDDNGADLAQGNADSSIDWIKSYAGQFYLAGNWANAAVDGCVDNATTPSPKRTVVVYTDQAAGKGYFLAMCKQADVSANYSFFGTPSDHNLVPIPRAPIATSSRVSGVTASLSMSAPDTAGLAAGVANLDATCTGTVRGYKVYTQLRPNAAGAPTDLHTASGWVAQGGEVAVANGTSSTVPCSAASSVWVANSLVFDSGFETAFVSAPQQVACDPTLATHPDNFKIIKKPRTTQQRRQQN